MPDDLSSLVSSMVQPSAPSDDLSSLVGSMVQPEKSVFSPEVQQRAAERDAANQNPVGGASGSWEQPSTMANIGGGLARAGTSAMASMESGIGEVGKLASGGQQFAGDIQAQAAQTQQQAVPGDPNSAAFQGANLAGNVAAGVPAVMGGPITAAGYFGLQGVGQNALTADQQRSEGKTVTPETQVKGDIAQAGLGALLAVVPPVFRKEEWVKGLIESALKMGGYQGLSNLATAATVNPNQSVTEGVPTAMAIGAGGHALAELASRAVRPAVESGQAAGGENPQPQTTVPGTETPPVVQESILGSGDSEHPTNSVPPLSASPGEPGTPSQQTTPPASPLVRQTPESSVSGSLEQGNEGGGQIQESPQVAEYNRQRVEELKTATTPQDVKEINDTFDRLVARQRPTPPPAGPWRPTGELKDTLDQAFAESDARMNQEQGAPFLGREGGQAPIIADVAEGIEDAYKKDLAPALKDAISGASDAIEGLKHTFGEQPGEQAEATREAFKAAGGQRARKMDQFDRAVLNDKRVTQLEKEMNRLPKDVLYGLTDDVERNMPVRRPEFQPVMDFLRERFNEALLAMRRADPTFRGVANYLARVYTDQNGAAKFFGDYFARRPMLPRSLSFSRVHQYFSDSRLAAAQAGFIAEPNPITAARLKLSQMYKWVGAHETANELRSQGIITQIQNNKLAAGMRRLPDPMFGGEQAPDEVASVFHNALDPGLASHKHFGPLVRGIKTVGNLLNQTTLGLSGYHGVGSAINSTISQAALGAENVAQGEFGRGAVNATIRAAIAPVHDMVAGKEFQDAWVNPSQATPEMRLIASAAQLQGARAFQDSSYHTSMIAGFQKALADADANWVSKGIRAGWRSPFAAIELAAKPIMEIQVPRLKNGAFVAMAREAMSRDPSINTPQELSAAMGPAWRTIDDRFGQVVHDNFFWNRTVKDLSQIVMRSVGWNAGSFRLFAGAAKDTARMALSKLAPSRVDAPNAPQGGMTHAMSYSLALPVVTGVMSAIYQFVHTGQGPQSAKDLLAPRDGGTTPTGDQERVQFPTYMKDVVGFWHSPLGTLADKASPMLGDIISLAQNRDYYGHPIHNPDSSAYSPTARMQDLKYLVKSATPYSIQDFLQKGGMASIMKNPERSAESFAGIMKAPQHVQRDAAEQEAFKYNGPDRDPDAEIKPGKPPATNLLERVEKVPVYQAVRTYMAGTDEEKSMLYGTVISKIEKTKSLSETERTRLVSQIMGAIPAKH